jgi:hypothetical protein
VAGGKSQRLRGIQAAESAGLETYGNPHKLLDVLDLVAARAKRPEALERRRLARGRLGLLDALDSGRLLLASTLDDNLLSRLLVVVVFEEGRLVLGARRDFGRGVPGARLADLAQVLIVVALGDEGEDVL